MKKLLIIAATLAIFTACKDGEDKNATVVTTEETTVKDTVGDEVVTKKAVTETTETDSTETTISTGGMETEPVE